MAKDRTGQSYTPPSPKQATDGTRIKINTSNGPKDGTMRGGYATFDKPKR